jgi:hypothetical protein
VAMSLGDDVIAVTVVYTDEADDKYHRLVVVIPEVGPSKPWEWLLHNQRGIILERAIRRGTSNVVLCRLRYRLATLAAAPTGADIK